MPTLLFPDSRVGPYTITRVLGAFGGQAIPYEAKDSSGKTIFLKQFHTPTPAMPNARQFMERQTALKDALDQIPAFVSVILDLFEFDGVFYQVAEWVNGTNLENLYTEIGSDLNPEVALLNAKVLAYSIKQIHAQGVAHLDLKPGNVIMERRGIGSSVADVFRIIDFDLAIVDGAPTQKSIGTPPYQAPEQINVDRFGSLGKHTDIFTLGVMLYQLLAVRFPFGADWPEGALKRSAVPPKEINPAIPSEVSQMVWRALCPVSSERPQAAEIHQALLNAERKPNRLDFRVGSLRFRKGEEFIFGKGYTEFRGLRGIETVSRRQLRFYKVGGDGSWEVALLSQRVPMQVDGELIPCNPNNPPRRLLERGNVIKVGTLEMVIDSL
jgi:serine/threonine protein kinase